MRLNSILEECLFWGECQYLVRWHGYRLFENCWIPLADMAMLAKLLKAWEDERTPLQHSPKLHRDIS